MKVGGIVEELDSFRCNVTLVDKAALSTNVTVLGIERISSDIKAVDIDGVRKLLKSPKAQDVDRPKEGEIDRLLDYECAAFHPVPVRIQAIGHLLLLQSRFGTVIGGKLPKLIENTKRIVQHVMIYYANVNIQIREAYQITKPMCLAR